VTAIQDIEAERERQVRGEGWDDHHDDEHVNRSLARAAGCYAMFADAFPYAGEPPPQWPWEREWWKPRSHRRNMVRAAAMLVAEIERIDRAAVNSTAVR
jgi:hypothetical protein